MSPSQKILFLDEVHPVLEEKLQSMGYICENDYKSSYEEVSQKIGDYFGLVIRSRIKIDKALLEKAASLQFIARSGAGLENINTAYAEKCGIKVFNSPEGNRDAVGEHALGMLLSLFNNLCRSNKEVRGYQWNREDNRGLELKGKTVGIIGFGNTGNSFAKKLQGFDCKIIAYDKYKDNFGSETVEEASFEDIFERSDVLSLHLPLSEETQYIVDHEFLQKFKKDFFLINTARGNHVKTRDLVRNLESGKVKGACLDVLEYEKASFEKLKKEELPGPFEQLLKMENVLLSPHVAGWTHESYYKLSAFLAEKIRAEFSR